MPYTVAPGTYHATLTVLTYYPSCTSVGYPVTVTVNTASVVSVSIAGNTIVCNGTAVTYTATVITSYSIHYTKLYELQTVVLPAMLTETTDAVLTVTVTG